jgi:cystathionine beta-synthase/cysteine synthase A
MAGPNFNNRTFESVLASVGNTPIVKLNKLSPNPDVEIWVKLEMFNPSGSIKDRIVAHIISNAEKTGLLKPGGTIIENTSGNTGAAVAMIAAAKGYKAILTMPDKVSIEKQNSLKAYGAQVIVCPTSAPPSSPDHYENKCKELAAATPNSFRINQYDNPLNPEAHILTTGPEIWNQMNGKIDYFVASGSTGGTISGIGGYLKQKNPNIKVVMPDPIGSVYYEFWKTGKVPAEEKGCTYFVEGVGEDHVCEAMNFKVVDEMYQFTDADAFAISRRLAKEEGIFAGGTAGANVWAAMKLAASLNKPAVIVTVAPDSGVKYLSKIYNDDWMREKGLLPQ